MKTVQKIKALSDEPGPICLAAGFFDGVHLGHQKVLDSARDRARALSGTVWVLTFDPHPLKVLVPAAAPPLLTCSSHKLALLARRGMDGAIVLPFTARTSAIEPDAFLAQLARGIPALRAIFVGADWAFGHGGRGNVAQLARWAADRKITITVEPPVTFDGAPVSSSRIRAAVADGRLTDAASMLGRPFSIYGTVVHGDGIGRSLGYPTLNLDPRNEVRPPFGIYAVRAIFDGQVRNGVCSHGLRPTLHRSATKPVIEVNLFDWDGDLYGHEVEVFLINRLRPEQQFPSREALVSQIASDAACARTLLDTPAEIYAWNNALQTWWPDCIVTP
ncbi:MAG: riboflavin biosynthesis protein RibF [bacterium]